MRESNYFHPDDGRTNILIVDTLYWDRFMPRRHENNDALFYGIENTGIWEGIGDKADLLPESYKMLNQLVERVPKTFPHTPGLGGTGANIYTKAAEALEGTGNEVNLIFFTAVSNNTSGQHIKKALSRYKNVRIYPELDDAHQSQVRSPTTFHFSLDGKKKSAKGPGYGTAEFIKPEHAKAVFNMKDPVTGKPIKIHRMFIPGSVVGRFDMETIFTLLPCAHTHETQIISAPPTKFTATNREFNDMMLAKYASEIRANMEELCQAFKLEETPQNKQLALQMALEAVGKRPHLFPSIAISDGLNGSYTGIPNKIAHTPVHNIDTMPVDNTGVGDAQAAGPEITLALGYDTQDTIAAGGFVGGVLADECIRHEGAQISSRSIAELVNEGLNEFKKARQQQGLGNARLSHPPKLIAARTKAAGIAHD